MTREVYSENTFDRLYKKLYLRPRKKKETKKRAKLLVIFLRLKISLIYNYQLR